MVPVTWIALFPCCSGVSLLELSIRNNRALIVKELLMNLDVVVQLFCPDMRWPR